MSNIYYINHYLFSLLMSIDLGCTCFGKPTRLDLRALPLLTATSALDIELSDTEDEQQQARREAVRGQKKKTSS